MLLSTVLVLLSSIQVSFVQPSVVRSTLYQRRRGSRLLGNQTYFPCPDGSCPGGRQACVIVCSLDTAYRSVNIRAHDGLCECSSAHMLQFGSQVQANGSWDNYSPVQNDVTVGDWLLVFRAQSDSDNTETEHMMAAWGNSTLHHNEQLQDMSADCYASVLSNCTSFYRARWLDTWQQDTIDQVRLSLFVGGSEEVRLVFNGRGSTRDTWFTQSRLLFSSWSDLNNTTSPAYFSMSSSGVPTFYISKAVGFDFQTCDAQVGWMMVFSAVSNVCAFDSSETLSEEYTPNYAAVYHTPRFLYAKNNMQTNFNNDVYGKADVLAVFIKLL